MLVVAQLLAELLDLERGIFHWPLIYNLTRNREHTISTYRNTVLIYNPRAGKIIRSGGSLIQRAVEILTQEGHTVTVAPTTGPNVAGAMARAQIAGGADLILVAGGDGTINETAEGMIGSKVPLGDSPGGHGERAGDGDEARRQSGKSRPRAGRTAAAADFGGPHHLRRRQSVAALPVDGRRGSGCSRRVPGECGAEGADRKVRLLGGGMEPAGQAAGRIRRGDRRASGGNVPSPC